MSNFLPCDTRVSNYNTLLRGCGSKTTVVKKEGSHYKLAEGVGTCINWLLFSQGHYTR